MEKLTNWSRKFVVLKRCLRLMPDRAAWTWCMMTRLNIVFMVIFDPRKLKNLMTLERQLTYGFQRKISYFMQFQSRKLVGCSRKSWEKLETKRSAVVQYYWWKWVICGFPGFKVSATTKLGPFWKMGEGPSIEVK